ncbi:tetratricopeptide repeat protein [Niveispirillum sp. BGYR6]|uniref:tetratricopeptide repeat protein n=1 Tax=Niveispirillum sp. BGYR6 TaxID=2971249 RepID=UPI0022B98300|nr:tetratricopeptide repeat protein [Niveispirillum sp. BGYR6]MDG5494776.1 tetratricopeptide repeat protein [Niveispirillum sp. BGYR6]
MRSVALVALRRRLLSAATVMALAVLPALAAISVSPEVGTPLKAAGEALAKKRYDQAVKEVEKAAAVKSITPDEKWAVEQMRAAIYKAQGQFDKAAIAFEAAIKLVPLPPDQQAGALETLSQLWYRHGDYAKSAAFGEKALAAGARSDGFRQMLAEAYYRSKNFAKSSKLAQAMVTEAQAAGRKPDAHMLQLLAASEFGTGNTDGYIKTLRQQLAAQSSRDNWQRLFDAMEKQKPIPDRLDMDWIRLKLAADAYENPDSYTEAAQRAAAEGTPGEAVTILDKGWQSGLLGQPGPKLERQERLRAYVREQADAQKKAIDEQQRQAIAAKDANALAKVGMARAMLGQLDQGIDLLQQALKGKPRLPARTRLWLGMLYYKAGQPKLAEQTLAAIPADSDEARLSTLWPLLAQGKR